MDDDLTVDERCRFRKCRMHIAKPSPRVRLAGVEIRWREAACFRVSLHLVVVSVSLTVQSFEAYRRATLSLGPYRNA